MTRGASLKTTDFWALLVWNLTVLPLCFCFAVSPVSIASAQVSSPSPGEPSPPAPTGAPSPPSIPTPEEEEEVPPPAPPAVPGAPVPEDVLDFQAPLPTTPSPAPGLVDRYQQRLDLIRPGQLLFNLTVEEVWDDNAFNTGTEGKEDFITVIVPAVAIDQRGAKTSLNLRYSPRILKYARFSELDRVDHSLRLAADWDPSPGLRVFLQDSLLITENTAQQASSLGISRSGLGRTTQNTLLTGLDVRLSPQDDLTVQYRNIIVDQDRGEDRMVNGGGVIWRHSLPRGSVSVTYNGAYVDRDVSANSFNHAGAVRTTYELNPNDQLLLAAVASFSDNEDADNSVVAGASVGLNHQFNPNLTMLVTGGIQGFRLEDGDSDPRFFTNSHLAWTFPKGSLTVGVVNRFQNTFSTVDDVGVVLETRGFANFSYQAAPRLSLSINGSYSQVDFQEQNREDLVGRFRINIRYQLWRRLFLTAGYNFFNRDSDVNVNDLTTNRVFIGLSLGLSKPI